jgi:hypothetical protein
MSEYGLARGILGQLGEAPENCLAATSISRRCLRRNASLVEEAAHRQSSWSVSSGGRADGDGPLMSVPADRAARAYLLAVTTGVRRISSSIRARSF